MTKRPDADAEVEDNAQHSQADALWGAKPGSQLEEGFLPVIAALCQDPHQFGGKSLQALLDPAHAQTYSQMSEPLSSLRDDTACPAFPQSQHLQACAGTQVLSVALKQAFSPSLPSWDRVKSIEERCVLCGKLLHDGFLQLRKSGCQELSWYNRYMTFQICPLGMAILWMDYLRRRLFYAQCGQEGGGVRGSVCFQGVRGLVSTSDLQ